MSVPRARLLDLMKAQCQLFSTTFNPEGLRLGNKILRKRLLGPTLASWYPPRLTTHKDIEREFAPYELTVDNAAEDDRRDHIANLKFRGKGAPKKIRTKKDPIMNKRKK